VRPELIDRVAAAWCQIAALPAGFTPEKITMGTSPASRLCPEGWVGALWLGLGRADAGAIVTAPDDATLAVVRERLSGVAPADVTDPRVWTPRPTPGGDGPPPPGVGDMRGPSTLAYLDPDDFRPRPSGEAVAVAMDKVHDQLAAIEAASGPDDTWMAGLRYATSPLFVVRRDGGIVAGCGYNPWRDSFAHMMVLTHPAHRRQGLAALVASAASAHALAAGLVPQWRATAGPSRAVAAALGYTPAGGQVSLRLDPAAPG
jgi:GNAT superfamily N-acetyltransferase